MDVTNIPARYSFLRLVEGHVVPVDDDQEDGPKAYKAKHFAPPCTPAARLCIFDRDRTSAKRPHLVDRQKTEGMMEFCVRLLTEGQDGEATMLGMIRLHANTTLAEARREIVHQLSGKAPVEYKFVRMLQGTVTWLTTSQEEQSSRGKNTLYVYHFAPPYTNNPELMLLAPKGYTEGEVIADETKTRELKSLREPLARPQSRHPKGMDPREVVKAKARTYINAFLNSSGGVLIFGASDDGVVERVPVSGHADADCQSLGKREKLARAAKDDIRKLIDGFCQNMDPPVDDDLVTTQFVPVHSTAAVTKAKGNRSTEEGEIYNVIEVHVKPGRRSLYFIDKHSSEAYERRDGSTRVMETDSVFDALSRGRRGDFWRGGWRQLRSAFEFDGLMRRLSDPWAGREWLFETIRTMLSDVSTPQAPTSDSPPIICLTGSRGTGKTVFLSELTLRPIDVTGVEVIAHHICRSDDVDTLNPSLFVQSISAMLARNCRQYRSLIIESASSPWSESIGASMLRALRPEHCETDPDDALLRGVLQPLKEIDRRVKEKRCRRPGRNKKSKMPLVIVVDAIDESLAAGTEQRPRSVSPTIAHLLERIANIGGLPPWIKLVVSFRRELIHVPGPIQRLANKFSSVLLNLDPSDDLTTQRSLEDVRLFITTYMHKVKMNFPLEDSSALTSDESSLSRVSGVETMSCFLCGEVGHMRSDCPRKCSKANEQKDVITRENELINALAKRSQGNFLYARTVLDDINSGFMSWEAVPTLPEGLDHLYMSFFRRHFQEEVMPVSTSGMRREIPAFRAVQPVLEILLAAGKRGVSEQEISHAIFSGGAKVDPSTVPFCLQDIRWALDVDSSFGGIERYRLGHESVRAWLEEAASTHAFSCRISRGHQMLAASLLQRSWPQQKALSRWLAANRDDDELSLEGDKGVITSWSEWARSEPRGDEIFHLVTHLSHADTGDEEERVALLKGVGKEMLDSVHGGGRKATALHFAALEGNVPAVRLLIGAGASADISVSGRSPLHIACGKGHAETTRTLLSAGAKVASKTSSGRTALVCAAGRGSLATVKVILDAIFRLEQNAGNDSQAAEARALLDACQADSGRTALSIAAEEGHDAVIAELVKVEADVTLADRYGRTALYYASRYGRLGADAVKILACAPGGLDTLSWGQGSHMRSPLHAAVWHGHVHVVRALLESGADPSLVESDGGSPLHEAAFFGSYGNDVARTHLNSAKKSKTTEFISSFGNDSPVDAAASLETSVEIPCETKNNGEKRLLSEEELDRLEILKLLLDSEKCIVNQGEVHGCTPLWYAAGGGWSDAVDLLLNAGACIDPGTLPHLPGKSRRGPASPLILAIERGHYETAKLLLSRGAQVPTSDRAHDRWRELSLPKDLVGDIKAARDKDHAGVSTDFPSPEVYAYTTSVKCKPVPKKSFACWPPARQVSFYEQAKDGDNNE